MPSSARRAGRSPARGSSGGSNGGGRSGSASPSRHRPTPRPKANASSCSPNTSRRRSSAKSPARRACWARGPSPANTKALLALVDEGSLASNPYAAAADRVSKASRGAFSAWTVVSLWPVIRASVQLTLHLVRPAAAVALAVAAAWGGWQPWACAVGAALLLLLVATRDEQVQRCVFGLHGLVKPGVYASRATARNRRLLSRCRALQPDIYGPWVRTPWLLTGDVRTLWPFVAFRHPPVPFHRRFVEVPRADFAKLDDAGHETVAVDWAVPAAGFDPAKPAVLILHGLNGGSSEPYVLDLVHAALAEGQTVCVMIARGLMDTRVGSDALFHGARTTDVEATVRHMRRALCGGDGGDGGGGGLPLIGAVGFSMGGIILANYVATSGAACELDAAVSISACPDPRLNQLYEHSAKRWQPALAHTLKLNFVVDNAERLPRRGASVEAVERCETVCDLDRHMVVPYHGFDDIFHYYREMGASCEGKLGRVAVPLLHLSACDDPITSVDSFAHALPMAASNPNLFFNLTAHGGHVGWPQGWLPSLYKWSWMSEHALSFLNDAMERR